MTQVCEVQSTTEAGNKGAQGQLYGFTLAYTDLPSHMVIIPLAVVLVNHHTVTLASQSPRGATMFKENLQLMCCSLVCFFCAGSPVKPDPWKQCSGLNWQTVAGYYACTTPVGPEHQSSYLTTSVLLIVMRGPSNLRKALSLMIYAEYLLRLPLQTFSLVL